MNYKYYIYKQATLNPYFNKYDFSQYDLLREINQNSKWGLDISRDDEWKSIVRDKFRGDITVKGTDFDALIALEETHIQYAIVIYLECNGVYTEFWKGFFSYFDFKVDLDKCHLTFVPLVWDAYSPIYDQMDVEQNILVASVPQTVLMKKPEFAFETLQYDYYLAGVYPPVASFDEYAYTPLPDPNEYYLWAQITWNFLPGRAEYYVYKIYRRDVGYTTCGLPGCEPSGSGDWVIELDSFGNPVEFSPGIFKWVRPYLHSDFTTYTHDFVGNYLYEVLIVDAAGGTTPPQLVPLIGCITLRSVIEYFATFFNLTYTSDFFHANPCPMGGDTLELTMLQQISNLRVTRDFAVKGIMTLHELLSNIRDIFECDWYIDPTGKFRIEHRKYFEWGYNYLTYIHNIELDLNLYPVNIKNMNRYEWETPKLYRFEKLNIAYSYSLDWVDAQIEYPQLSIMGNMTKKIITKWGTDAFSMWDSKGELPREGWLLLDCYQQYVPKAIKIVRDTIGAISNGDPFQNARFSSANLMRDLWKFGRILPTGKVNNFTTTFSSIEKLRKQVTLSIPQCCQDLDYNGIFRTDLGDGLIDSAEYEANTGMLKVNLIYE